MRIGLRIAGVVLLFLLAGCGGGSGGNNPLPAGSVRLTVTPNSAVVITGGTKSFTASVVNTANKAVTWSVQEGAAGGTIDANGNYTAPATQGTYHIIATSQADTSKTVTITVTVVPPVRVSPATTTVYTSGIKTFSATGPDASVIPVTWSVQEGAAGGTIDANGLYTAPATPGTYHIVATSQADATKTGTATVTVLANPITVAPPTVTLSVGGTSSFTAKLNGTPTTAVNWSVQEGNAGGTIDANGNYTAPATPGTYHVLVTSQSDATQQATAVVTVQAGNAQVGVQ
ncbi:MAG TPA: hypothetical protein VFB21_24155 [Chthonomonadaceae bacterium]|nr:hypothetical protein [Chthonomonadaceae bacterium]